MSKPAFKPAAYDPLDDPYCSPPPVRLPGAVTLPSSLPQMDCEVDFQPPAPKSEAPVLVPTSHSSEDPLRANKQPAPAIPISPLGPEADSEAARPRPRVSRKPTPPSDPVSTKSCECQVV